LKTLGTIFQSIDGSTCIVDYSTMGIGGLILVEKGFWDVVGCGGTIGGCGGAIEGCA
jgi:hypothetical protein